VLFDIGENKKEQKSRETVMSRNKWSFPEMLGSEMNFLKSHPNEFFSYHQATVTFTSEISSPCCLVVPQALFERGVSQISLQLYPDCVDGHVTQ